MEKELKEFKVFVYMQPYEYNVEAKDEKDAREKALKGL